jgi:O-antigen ligase
MPHTGFVLAALLAAALAPSALLAGNPRRALVQLAVLGYVALIHQVALATGALGLRRLALRALVGGAAVACAVGLVATCLAWAGGHPAHLAVQYPWMPIARPLGPTESPTMLAMVALAGIAATLRLRRESAVPPWMTPALAGLFGLTLVLSQSRVLLAAAAGAGAGWAWASRQHQRSGAGTIRSAGGLLLGGAAVGVLLLSLWFRVVPLRPALPFIDTGIGPYRVCHEIAWSMFRAHPLTGVGLENFHRAWPGHYDSGRHDLAYRGGAEPLRGRPLDPHGTVQGYLAEGGLPGLAVVMIATYLMWRRRGPNPETLGFLVALGCALFFTDLLTERSTFATLGLLLSTNRQPSADAPIPPSHPPGTRR